jgi:N-acetylated-alpha-linked acidic dipeptidase
MRTRFLPSLLAAPALSLVAAMSLAVAASDTPTPLFGFNASDSTTQRALESQFDAQLSAADQRAWMQTLSAQPNQVGSPHDKANAEFILAKFKEWGWDAHIERFDVLYPTLRSHTLEMLAPVAFKAKLHEPAVAGDASSANTAAAMPPYNAYGADGDVTGDLVYVNQGMPDDYLRLERAGVSVKGRIVITRYGGGWRGLKPKLAQEHGAIGCIIYSDPKEDGYGIGDTYPKGGQRPADGVQRGSVADMPVYPGDPLTPGVGASKNAKRLPISEAKTLLKIPVLPISYGDAQPMLAALGGEVVPANWRGALPITYHFGPGPAKIHLAIKSDWTQKPLYDVIAMIRGSELPDQWIIRGNHQDGWVFGAWDPLSGNVAMLSEAKALGTLLKSGWKPRRTIVYASWDGEEPGLLGSTEWVEEHAEELSHKALLYVNSDTNSRGFLGVGGSHALQHVINDVAAGVTDPQTGVSVQARMRAALMVDGYDPSANGEERAAAKQAAEDGDLDIEALGSGSDFTPFLQHLGVATLNLGFGGEDAQAGVYHSIYDSFEHFDRFGDPGFVYGVALSKTAGHTVLRFADAVLPPLRFADLASTLEGYAKELHALADGKRESTAMLMKLLDRDAFRLASDPTHPTAAPHREDLVPYLNLAPVDNAVATLKRSATACDAAYAKALTAGLKPSAALNELLRGLEQTFTAPQGLPGRDWYRHLIYAPGLYTGYGVKTMPGVREAIEQRNWDLANSYAQFTGKVVEAYAARLDAATALLAAGGK